MKQIILPLFLSLAFTAPLSTVFARDIDVDRRIEDLEKELKILKLEREISQLKGQTQQPLPSTPSYNQDSGLGLGSISNAPQEKSSYSPNQTSSTTPCISKKEQQEQDDYVLALQLAEEGTEYSVQNSNRDITSPITDTHNNLSFSTPSAVVQTHETSSKQTKISVNEIVFPQEWRTTAKFSAVLSKESALPGILQQLNIKIDETSYDRAISCKAQKGKSTPGHIRNAGKDSFLIFTAIMNGGQEYHKNDGGQYVAELLLGNIVTKEDLANIGYSSYFPEIKEKIQQIQRNRREKRFKEAAYEFILSKLS